MRALAIAATGMDAQQTNLEVIANNIANINTTGYKRARAEFTDLLYQTERMQGVPNRANQAIVPEGANIGLGVQTSAVRNIHTQGNLIETGNKLDVAIIGQGWFQIEAADGSTLYSRAGCLQQECRRQPGDGRWLQCHSEHQYPDRRAGHHHYPHGSGDCAHRQCR